jgi:hypothetical protein
MVDPTSTRTRHFAPRHSRTIVSTADDAPHGVADATRPSPQSRPAPKEPKASKEPRIQRIARRAHEIYVARGGEHGKALDDWLRAEREIDAEDEQRS